MVTPHTSLGSLIECLTTLPMKEFLLRSTPNLPGITWGCCITSFMGLSTCKGCLWSRAQKLLMPSLLPSLPEVLSLGMRLHRREHPFGQVPSLFLAQPKTNRCQGLETKRKPGCCSATLLCWNWCVICTFLAKKPNIALCGLKHEESYLCPSQTQYSPKKNTVMTVKAVHTSRSFQICRWLQIGLSRGLILQWMSLSLWSWFNGQNFAKKHHLGISILWNVCFNISNISNDNISLWYYMPLI